MACYRGGCACVGDLRACATWVECQRVQGRLSAPVGGVGGVVILVALVILEEILSW